MPTACKYRPARRSIDRAAAAVASFLLLPSQSSSSPPPSVRLGRLGERAPRRAEQAHLSAARLTWARARARALAKTGKGKGSARGEMKEGLSRVVGGVGVVVGDRVGADTRRSTIARRPDHYRAAPITRQRRRHHYLCVPRRRQLAWRLARQHTETTLYIYIYLYSESCGSGHVRNTQTRH